MPEICRQPRDPGGDVNALLIPAEQRVDRKRVPVVMDTRTDGRAGANPRVVGERAVEWADGLVDDAGAAQRDEEAVCARVGQQLLADTVVALERVNRAWVERHES